MAEGRRTAEAGKTKKCVRCKKVKEVAEFDAYGHKTRVACTPCLHPELRKLAELAELTEDVGRRLAPLATKQDVSAGYEAAAAALTAPLKELAGHYAAMREHTKKLEEKQEEMEKEQRALRAEYLAAEKATAALVQAVADAASAAVDAYKEEVSGQLAALEARLRERKEEETAQIVGAVVEKLATRRQAVALVQVPGASAHGSAAQSPRAGPQTPKTPAGVKAETDELSNEIKILQTRIGKLQKQERTPAQEQELRDKQAQVETLKAERAEKKKRGT